MHLYALISAKIIFIKLLIYIVACFLHNIISVVIYGKQLAPAIVLLEVEDPAVAAKVGPGQFVIVRKDEKSERIPLTVMDFDLVREEQ